MQHVPQVRDAAMPVAEEMRGRRETAALVVGGESVGAEVGRTAVDAHDRRGLLPAIEVRLIVTDGGDNQDGDLLAAERLTGGALVCGVFTQSRVRNGRRMNTSH